MRGEPEVQNEASERGGASAAIEIELATAELLSIVDTGNRTPMRPWMETVSSFCRASSIRCHDLGGVAA